MTVRPQAPRSAFDWSLDWSEWLSPDDSVASVAWGIEPSGATLSGAMVVGATTTIKVVGLQDGKTYRVTATITTSAGLVADQSIVLRGMRR